MFPHVSETEVGKSPYWLPDLEHPVFVLTAILVSVGKKESGGGSSAGFNLSTVDIWGWVILCGVNLSCAR